VVREEHHPNSLNNLAHHNRLIEVERMQELELSNVNHDNVHPADEIQNWSLERGTWFGNNGRLKIHQLGVGWRWGTI
jgi:hypothetical protein